MKFSEQMLLITKGYSKKEIQELKDMEAEELKAAMQEEAPEEETVKEEAKHNEEPDYKKLYEELLMSEEGLRQTLNKKIYIGQKIDFDHDMFVRQLEELRLLADDCTGNFAEIEQKVMEIVPTFKRSPLSCVHYDVPVNGVPAL